MHSTLRMGSWLVTLALAFAAAETACVPPARGRLRAHGASRIAGRRSGIRVPCRGVPPDRAPLPA